MASISKTKSYYIGIERSFYHSNSARRAASVAVRWMRNGLRPEATVLINDGPGPLRIEEVCITTVAQTAKALAAAGREESVIARGSNADREAFAFAGSAQGYCGNWADWCRMPLSERQSYERGAAGGGAGIRVIER